MYIPPVTFIENPAFYDKLTQKYKPHSKGLFILAPSGAGKTHFCNNQTEPNWIDGDKIWYSAKAHPKGAWWLEPGEKIGRIDARSDIITYEAKAQGFWIIGASNQWLKPDAIVIPEWDTHVAQIKHREENGYDGGATSNDLEQVKLHINIIRRWNTEESVPIFKTVAEATKYLSGE